eukprot:TRINITY_DN69380_c0_g1_i1.p1 TRINITY_DN69380_c0_g1~~TRINITY_DN69380_c0_g1_i1.p1  ORF type:complete len:567 (+),score=65.59 TRINITY_DN69380_c0_g1_i1:79-1779(+)
MEPSRFYSRPHCRPLSWSDTQRAQREGLEEFEDRSVGCVALCLRGPLSPSALMRKSKGADEWVFPKGHPNEGETDTETARRECLEETGVHVTTIHEATFCDVGYSGIKHMHADRWRLHKDFPDEAKRPILVTHKTVRFYLAIVSDRDAHQVAKEPSQQADAVRWVGIAEVEGRLSRDEQKKVWRHLLTSPEADALFLASSGSLAAVLSPLPALGGIGNGESLLERVLKLDASIHRRRYVPFLMGEGRCVGQVERSLLPVLLETTCAASNSLVFALKSAPRCDCIEEFRLRAEWDISHERRTHALDLATERLIERGKLCRRHGELVPVSEGWGQQELCVVDENAAPLFGVTSLGVHLIAYTTEEPSGRVNGVWMAQRTPLRSNPTSSLWPHRWDPTVAGGAKAGLSLYDNVLKKAAEEAGIESPITVSRIVASGCTSLMTANPDGSDLKQSLYFAWDLRVDTGFKPQPADGDVHEFALWSLAELEREVRTGVRLRPAMVPVMVAFLIRHGIITADTEPDYVRLLSALHRDRLEVGIEQNEDERELNRELEEYRSKRARRALPLSSVR